MKKVMMLLLFVVFSGPLTLMASDYVQLQTQWAIVNYDTDPEHKSASFSALAADAKKSVETKPDDPELRIWYGIILSSWAGADGGLGALGHVKEARKQLEKALALNPAALEGSAFTSLGALYYQVPSWPLAFGDKEEAERLLRHALEVNPHGIDSNYFMGDYLLREKRTEEARQYLSRALEAAPRPGRELADQGRREEIRQLLAQIK
jgi:tetratricopeptide (TPR) repeat protein